MTLLRWTRALSPALILAVLAGPGCSEEREIFSNRVGDYLFEFPIEAAFAGGRPAGSSAVLDFEVAAVDPTHPDALGRSVTGPRNGFITNSSAFGAGWSIAGTRARNATADPRLPAIQSTTAELTGAIAFDAPNAWGAPGFHNVWTNVGPGSGSYSQFAGLQPGTVYTVALFRYGLQVNGELDHIQAARGLPVSQPDQLVPLGGSPKGDPTQPIVAFPTYIPAQADANPFVLGRFTANASGASHMDVVITSNADDGQPVLFATTSNNPSDAAMDSALIARNDLEATTFPRYNYLVVLEGAANTAAEAAALPQVLRIQLGADLDPTTGAVIPNAYAPFPVEMTKAQLLAGAGVAGKVSEMRFSFSDMAELSGATYQVWLVNDQTGQSYSPAVDWVATMPDPEVEESPPPIEVASGTGVRTFTSKSHWTHTFELGDASAGRAIGDFTHVVVSIESSEVSADGSPSNAQPLWLRHTDTNDEPDNPFAWTFVNQGTASFGTFNLGVQPAVFTARGTGRGWFWGTSPDDEARVRLRDLNQPPVGYFYEGWMFPDPARGNPFPIGPLTTGPEEGFTPLTDADVNTAVSAYIRDSDGRILDALNIVRVGDLLNGNPWHLLEYHLKVVPKARAAPSADVPPYTILGGAVPEAVHRRAP